MKRFGKSLLMLGIIAGFVWCTPLSLAQAATASGKNATKALSTSKEQTATAPAAVKSALSPRVDAPPDNHRSSIAQYGITWTFDRAYETGQFVNGDWWVVGPVTIVSVSPGPVGSGEGYRNGSMVNPMLGNDGDDQAYDGRVWGFQESLAVRYPATLQPGSSLVSTESIMTYPFRVESDPNHYPAFYRSTAEQVIGPTQTALKNAAILTVVSAAPMPGSFRPPYVGNAKPMFNRSQISMQRLPRVAPPEYHVPDYRLLERAVERPWIDLKRQWMKSNIAPINNQVSYGRDVANVLGDLALYLCLNVPDAQKEKMMIGYIQIGIDHYYATLLNQHLWDSSGGYNVGRKAPILVAGLLLNRPEMMNLRGVGFQEDQQTYFGSGEQPGEKLWSDWQNSGHPYAANVLFEIEESPDTRGHNWHYEAYMPEEWVSRSDVFPYNPGQYTHQYPWDRPMGYQRLVSYSIIGQSMAMRLMGLKDAWAHNAYFAYVDRWMNEDDAAVRARLAAVAAANNWDAYEHYDNFSWTNPEVYYPHGGLNSPSVSLSAFAKDMYVNYRSAFPAQ